MNSLMVIFPYWHPSGFFAFDDEAVGLHQEPFVDGMTKILYTACNDAGLGKDANGKTWVKNLEKGFSLVFSAVPFPGHKHVLNWKSAASGGNYYDLDGGALIGWLCPALLKYFADAPKQIYCMVKEKQN